MTEETSSTIQDLLNSVVDGKIDEFDVDLETGRLKGENFLGDIVFVGLKNKKTKDELHLVVKQTIDLGSMVTLSFAYPTEIYFYEEVWPALNKFQQNSSVGFNNIAKCYATSKTKGKEKLVLEDLNFKNFKLFDKVKTLEHQHLEHIFKCYGQFHAISSAFHGLHPEEFARFESFTNRDAFKAPEKADKKSTSNDPLMKPLYDLRSLFDEKTQGHLVKVYDEMLEVIKDDIFKKLLEYKGETKFLLHGDCWSNNMMFKYDEKGNVIDMKFLDFQMISVGSPVKDLAYCLYTGAWKDSLDKLDDLLTIYMKSFNETLEKLNYKPEKPYTMETLKSEWKQLSLIGFFLALGIWRMKLVDKKNIPKITDFDETKNKEIRLPEVAEEHLDVFNEIMKGLIVHFCENRFFCK